MTPQLTNQPPSTDVSTVTTPTKSLNPSEKSPRYVLLPPSPTSSEDEALDTTPVPRSYTRERGKSMNVSSSPHTALPHRYNLSSPVPAPRSHSPADNSSAPQMQRAYSSPGIDSSGRYIPFGGTVPRRPASPLSSGRRRSPLRSAFEDSYSNSWSGLYIEPNIPEHAELEISSPITPDDGLGSMGTMPSYSNTFPRSRRRPTSPLHPSASAPSLHARAFSPHRTSGAASSPSLSASKYTNEPYPSYSFSSTSSMPSTPTSFRSRSPSISSLETIEDIPDAEDAATIEDEDLRRDDSEGNADSRRRSLEIRGSGLRSNKERKRWSVCGAERRADFSLEPIEE